MQKVTLFAEGERLQQPFWRLKTFFILRFYILAQVRRRALCGRSEMPSERDCRRLAPIDVRSEYTSQPTDGRALRTEY